jgi:hypothetical protein
MTVVSVRTNTVLVVLVVVGVVLVLRLRLLRLIIHRGSGLGPERLVVMVIPTTIRLVLIKHMLVAVVVVVRMHSGRSNQDLLV